jgi:hypothetical protein
VQARRGIAGRFLRAAFGLRSEPPTDTSSVISLIENGWTETMAMGAWTASWAVTGALLLAAGQAVHSWSLRSLTIAAMPMAISVAGFIIHMCRAALALSAGRNLAVKKQPERAYTRAVVWLTMTTPWVLVPQVLIGMGLAIFVSSHTI